MKNISFSSNYRFNIGNKYPQAVMNNLYNYIGSEGKIIAEYTNQIEARNSDIFEKISIEVPDIMDSDIEKILKSEGIEFYKQTIDKTIDLDDIKRRIELDKADKRKNVKLIEVETEKLEQLIRRDKLSYIEKQGMNSDGDKYKNFGEYLKTGKKIYATKINIDKSPKGEILVNIIDGRHRYAYLRDIGMKRIPIAIDKKSYDTGLKYNLL